MHHHGTKTAVQPQPAAGVQPQPAAGAQPQPAAVQPQAAAGVQPQPATSTQPQPAAGTQPQPAAASGSRGTAKGYGLIAAVYLLGLFIGALDMGIVTPARTVIQNTMGVEDSLGIWMLTIYTLAYAASIPVMGKLADKFGRKYIYLTCVALFGLGSLLCGLSQTTNSFAMLIISRAIQAVGAGGVMPVATAEFGTAFPEEKRGMALGLVGGVYGIANVFGASAGSAILDIFGQANWQFIFFLNVPICVFILIAGFAKLQNAKEVDVRPIDGVGILVMTVMILSLMYGLKNIDFFSIADSVASADVWLFLLIFVVLLPVFIAVEHRAADPVMNLSYFKDRDILITLVCSIGTGIIMMASVFIPQFCENSLMIRSGAGGYFVIILGLFAGLGSPMSGKLIDKFGVRPVLGFGFAAAAAGALYAAFVACTWPNVVNVVLSLVLTGLGMGFTMGTPLNYMMLQKTDDSQSNSALATLSLVRSIGTAIAPAIMVAFIAHAGASMQAELMEALPKTVSVSPLPYAQELDAELAAMRSNEAMAEMLGEMGEMTFADYTTIDVSMEGMGGASESSTAGEESASASEAGSESASAGSGVTVSEEALEQLENADVITVVDAVKTMAGEMFDQVKPGLVENAQSGVQQGIDAIQSAAGAMGAATSGASEIVAQLEAVRDAIPAMFDEAQENYLEAIDESATAIQETYRATLNSGFSGMYVFSACCSIIGFVLTMFYRDRRPKAPEE